jgi:hypothetical protein
VNNAQFERLCSGLRSTLMDHYNIQFTVEWAKLMIAFYAHDGRQRSFDWQNTLIEPKTVRVSTSFVKIRVQSDALLKEIESKVFQIT